jgi:aminopeptidase YwaD
MLRFPLPTLALLALACTPDSDSQPQDTAAPEPGLADEARLLEHVRTLSSDEYGGREPGTEGGQLAEAYIEDHFTALGLEGAGDDGGFRQHFPLQRYTVSGPSELSIDGTDYSEGSSYELFLYSGAAEVEGELVFVGYGLTVPPFDPADYPGCPVDPAGYDDYRGQDLAGRIAVVMRHGPNDDWDMGEDCPVNEAGLGDGDLFTFGYKAANAALHGASAMLLFTDYQHGDGSPEGGTLSEDYYLPDLPALYVGRGVLEHHLPELEAWAAVIDGGLEPNPQATGVQARVLTQTEVSAISVPNLLARIPGSDPDLAEEAIVVGAHFDHLGTDGAGNIYHGADDNASGTAVLLELAQLFAEWGVQPARTLVFAAFNAEELGLIGSMYYVIDPPHPIPDTVAMLNLDMVGGGDELGLIDFGGTEDGSEALYDLLATQASEDFPVTPLDASANSDHAWFQYSGVPIAFLFTTGAHAPYHTPEDTFDTISGLELHETARISWDTLRILAMGEEEAVLEAAQADRRAPPPVVPPERIPPLGIPATR